ncbi:DEAD/DEAH box helicase [Desulfopila sp. IMCC35006]|uniref:DEAD/DEAH box helicase n=1 Tax=Desulfopila sp. IMCC35006 TaxID=2569542 RepID=UPI0010AC09E1|nr:DEAD/DEAH box helicase [Desulfopila sp. IMCC35006]TKB24453.1 DEAD/DEAH box helicase [Desulfopila sp. IMCC35006]
MKKTILAVGKKIRNLVQAGKHRYGRFGNLFGRPDPVLENEQPVLAEVPARRTAEQRAGTNKVSDQHAVPVAKQGKYRAPEKSRQKPAWSLDDFPVVPAEGKSRFHDYPIPLPVMQAIADQKFEYCTPIQEKSLESVLAGKDLVGKANTGTGKTAVFLIAVLSRLLSDKKTGKGNVRALVLAPTRELVSQIAKEGQAFAKYCNLSVRAVYGGVDYQKQMDYLQNKQCDLLVATPGRLIDFMNKRVVDLSSCQILVLDEADRMLDMGFIPDVRRIVGRLPAKKDRQTMLFSATVSEDVQRLASQWSVQPKVVEAEPEQVAVDTVEQIVYLVTAEEKYAVLYNLIQQNPDDRIIVFANMKNETKRLANRLQRNNIDCVLLSGDVDQNKRMTRLENFRSGKVKVLVATDVAGRGIHIDGITFVVNYTLPYEPEDYVHRIGRTGRAGANGKAVSFACEEGSFYLPAIEEFINKKFDCVLPEETLLAPPPKGQDKKLESDGQPPRPKRKKSGSRNYPRGRRGSEKKTA